MSAGPPGRHASPAPPVDPGRPLRAALIFLALGNSVTTRLWAARAHPGLTAPFKLLTTDTVRIGLVSLGVPVEFRFEPLPLPTSRRAEFQIQSRADVSLGARPLTERAPSNGDGLDEPAHVGSSTGLGSSAFQDRAMGSVIPAAVAL